MSPVMRFQKEKRVLFCDIRIKNQEENDMSKKGYSKPGLFGGYNHYDE